MKHVVRSSKRNIILIISLVLNIIFGTGAGYFVYKRGGTPYLKVKIMEQFDDNNALKYNAYYLQKVSIFRELPNQTQDIYFVGDSITEFGEWHELLFLKHARNRGINGDTTAGVLNRMDEVIEGSPAKVFIMCGINDILRNVPAGEIMDEFEKIISKLDRLGPKSSVYIQSILPINQVEYKKSSNRKYFGRHVPTNEIVRDLNNRIELLANRYSNVQYVNLSMLTDTNGELRAEFTMDGLHLNGKGLVAWAQLITPLAQQ